MVEGPKGLMQTNAEELAVDELPWPKEQSVSNWLEDFLKYYRLLRLTY
jgi:hypothetical protein